MPNAVVENWDEVYAYLATQPLCQWAAQKQQELKSGQHLERGRQSIHAAPKKNDNADLAAALASMA